MDIVITAVQHALRGERAEQAQPSGADAPEPRDLRNDADPALAHVPDHPLDHLVHASASRGGTEGPAGLPPRTVVVRVSGEIDLYTGPRLRQVLVGMLSAPLTKTDSPADSDSDSADSHVTGGSGVPAGVPGGVPGGVDGAAGANPAQRAVGTAGAGAVITDLRQVSFMDSYALGVLVAAHKRAKAAGRGFALVATSDITVKLFDMTGLGRVMTLHPDLTSATAALAAAGSDTRL